MSARIRMVIGIYLVCVAGSAFGFTRWKGSTTGFWDNPINWAGGFPTTNTTLQLDHQVQTNAYFVVVRSSGLNDKPWLQGFGELPVRVTVSAGGNLQLYNLRMGGSLTDCETSFMIDGGLVMGLGPVNPMTGTDHALGIPNQEIRWDWAYHNGCWQVHSSPTLEIPTRGRSGPLTVPTMS